MLRRLRVVMPRVRVELWTCKRRLPLVTCVVRNKEAKVNVSCSPPKCPAVLPPRSHDDEPATFGAGACGREPPRLTPRPRTGRSTGSLGVRPVATCTPCTPASLIRRRTPLVSPSVMCCAESTNSIISRCRSTCPSNQQVVNLNLAN